MAGLLRKKSDGLNWIKGSLTILNILANDGT